MRKEFVHHELIGLHILVSDAKNPSLIGLKGKIIDETKNTIVIEHDKTTKKLLKNQITMKLRHDKNYVEIEGRKIVGKPEVRIKK